ncbi:MAG: hypothetical protein IJH90_05755 [Mogibacterium sp.]|nr:hypothetical protein [Mogibacterium sp.]MBQ6389124.1 hypothetical protein [Mogibacterium sp.]
MEERTNFKDTSAACAKLPREVYYRCIWLVRDAERLRTVSEPGDHPFPDGMDIIVSEAVIRKARGDLAHIDAALNMIPEVYRSGVINNITRGDPFSDLAHPNTWKKWKRIFISELAKELDLI